jgi:hypothetical protein
LNPGTPENESGVHFFVAFIAAKHISDQISAEL